MKYIHRIFIFLMLSAVSISSVCALDYPEIEFVNECGEARMLHLDYQFLQRYRERFGVDPNRATLKFVETLNSSYISFFCGNPEEVVGAVDAFRSMSERGVAAGSFMLGVSYFFGVGVVKDYSKSEAQFRHCEDSRGGSCNVFLGVIYLYGVAGGVDLRAASDQFRAAKIKGSKYSLELYSLTKCMEEVVESSDEKHSCKRPLSKVSILKDFVVSNKGI